MKILILEDEQGITEFYSEILKEYFSEVEIDEVNLIENLVKKNLNLYDLIMVDCNLPDGNGYTEIAEKLFKGELDYPVKIFISGIPYAEMIFSEGKPFPTIDKCYFLSKPVLDKVLTDIFEKEF